MHAAIVVSAAAAAILLLTVHYKSEKHVGLRNCWRGRCRRRISRCLATRRCATDTRRPRDRWCGKIAPLRDVMTSAFDVWRCWCCDQIHLRNGSNIWKSGVKCNRRGIIMELNAALIDSRPCGHFRSTLMSSSNSPVLKRRYGLISRDLHQFRAS